MYRYCRRRVRSSGNKPFILALAFRLTFRVARFTRWSPGWSDFALIPFASSRHLVDSFSTRLTTANWSFVIGFSLCDVAFCSRTKTCRRVFPYGIVPVAESDFPGRVKYTKTSGRRILQFARRRFDRLLFMLTSRYNGRV